MNQAGSESTKILAPDFRQETQASVDKYQEEKAISALGNSIDALQTIAQTPEQSQQGVAGSELAAIPQEQPAQVQPEANTKEQFQGMLENMFADMRQIDLSNLENPKDLEKVLKKYPQLFSQTELRDAKGNIIRDSLDKIADLQTSGKAWLRGTLEKLVKHSPKFALVAGTILSGSPVGGGILALYVLAKTQGADKLISLANTADKQFLSSKRDIDEMKDKISRERNQRIRALVNKFSRSELTPIELEEFRNKVDELIQETNTDFEQLASNLKLAREQKETAEELMRNARTQEGDEQYRRENASNQQQLEQLAGQPAA